ncbi:MAG: DNA mismatch repair protein MutS [Candidatus Absconditicoccaceae bacterium]
MTLTPAMQQYLDMKKQYSDCILFFRIGDFYETFREDAKICNKVLDLVLTSKNKNAENPIPMAGIPYHSADKYVTKLVKNGFKIAIAEQTSEATPGKIVQREVTEIITPGTYIQENSKNYTYTLGIYFQAQKDMNNFHIAWGDFGVGTYQTKSFRDIGQMQKFILSIKPVEIVVDVDFPSKDEVVGIMKKYIQSLISVHDVPVNVDQYIANQCNVQTISSYGKALEDGRLQVFGLLISYLKNTQKKNLNNIVRISLHNQESQVLLDEITTKNLEIFSSSYEQSEKYSLVGILDNCKTTVGSRCLRYIIGHPINDMHELNYRLDNIQYYFDNLEKTKEIHHNLSDVKDISKLVSNILYRRLLPSSFVKLRQTLEVFFGDGYIIKNEIMRLGIAKEYFDNVSDLYTYLVKLIKKDEEYKDDINFVNDKYNTEIDELRKIAYHSDELLLNYQQELVKLTGVNNVKLKYVMNQGYFIGITNKDIETFESKAFSSKDDSEGKFNLIRRNTLKGEQRYVSDYLGNIESKVLEARDILAKKEFELLEIAKQKIAGISIALNEFNEKIGRLDIFSSQALLAKEKNYVRPDFINGKATEIIGGRHPVIEEFLAQDQQFIPNGINISSDDDTKDEIGFLHIITGPNMGGKSTYLRQNALIVLMAHCGLFVSAKKINMCLVDGIFARIGSGDIIAKNQSTFMTEMIEVANILNNASDKSFVIFDELGRGTSTYDGLALTKAILEYITMNIGCKTLIATHYHELIALENNLAGVKNFSVSVYETDKEVVFMKKIVKGGASKSYGLDVATIAGIPRTIIDRARENLGELEKKNEDKKVGIGFRSPSLPLGAFSTRVDPQFDKVKNIIKGFDIENITPLQAMDILNKIKEELGRG